MDRKIVSDVGLVQLEQEGNHIFAIAEEGKTPSKFWAEGWAFTPEEVHREFFAFWDNFWNAPDLHGGEDPFGMNLLTGFPDTLNAEITGFDVRQIVKCTKTNTSVGSDAWSLNDFKMMPDIVVELLATAWNKIFNDQCYVPATFSMARVLLLAKHLEADTISSSRPITICPLAYRLCSRAMTRKLTGQLLGFFPVGVLGGLPQKAGWECFYKAQVVVENAQMTNNQLCGLTTDVVKMFNAVRRPVVAALLERAGVPAATARAWIAHLDTMKRYLRVQKSLSAGHLSSVGIPKGDALSVLVATLFGAIWCKAIRSGDGGAAVPTANIDNLDVVARTGRELEHACEVISQLERMWGLAFDLKKSWCWDLDFKTEERPSIQMERHQWGKSLGAAMTYNKRPFNSIQVKRIQSVYCRIVRLGKLPVTDQEKCRLVKSGIWPAAFYGAETTYLGKQWYVTLRDLVAAALNK